MARTRLFILTYKRPNALRNNLESLFTSGIEDCDVYIINNHSKFVMDEKFNDQVKVLHNVLRPDWSEGYLTRSWNQALLLGFESLSQPACEHVIHCQDDTIFRPGWLSYVRECHKTYTFMTFGGGDAFVSYLPEAVKKIGIWDERFIFGSNDNDYLLRARIYNGEKSSINDFSHGRVLNPVPDNFKEGENEHWRNGNHNVIYTPIRDDELIHPFSFSMQIGQKLYHTKWNHYPGCQWGGEPPSKPSIPCYLTYPYFEKDVEDLEGKGYFL